MRRVMVGLDQYCYERQVALTYIDMRWGNALYSFCFPCFPSFSNVLKGITDEMGKEYKTILSCLQEVNNSRPYFVGIIGQVLFLLPLSFSLAF